MEGIFSYQHRSKDIFDHIIDRLLCFSIDTGPRCCFSYAIRAIVSSNFYDHIVCAGHMSRFPVDRTICKWNIYRYCLSICYLHLFYPILSFFNSLIHRNPMTTAAINFSKTRCSIDIGEHDSRYCHLRGHYNTSSSIKGQDLPIAGRICRNRITDRCQAARKCDQLHRFNPVHITHEKGKKRKPDQLPGRQNSRYRFHGEACLNKQQRARIHNVVGQAQRQRMKQYQPPKQRGMQSGSICIMILYVSVFIYCRLPSVFIRRIFFFRFHFCRINAVRILPHIRGLINNEERKHKPYYTCSSEKVVAIFPVSSGNRVDQPCNKRSRHHACKYSACIHDRTACSSSFQEPVADYRLCGHK